MFSAAMAYLGSATRRRTCKTKQLTNGLYVLYGLLWHSRRHREAGGREGLAESTRPRVTEAAGKCGVSFQGGSCTRNMRKPSTIRKKRRMPLTRTRHTRGSTAPFASLVKKRVSGELLRRRTQVKSIAMQGWRRWPSRPVDGQRQPKTPRLTNTRLRINIPFGFDRFLAIRPALVLRTFRHEPYGSHPWEQA